MQNALHPAEAQQWSLLLCYAMLSHFSRVQLCVTPEMAAHQAPPSLGFSRQERLEWVAISFSNAWKLKEKVKSLSCVRLLATPWTAAHQAPPSMGFSRQVYWSGVPLPSPPTQRFFSLLSPTLEKHCYMELRCWEDRDLHCHCHDNRIRDVKNFFPKQWATVNK